MSHGSKATECLSAPISSWNVIGIHQMVRWYATNHVNIAMQQAKGADPGVWGLDW